MAAIRGSSVGERTSTGFSYAQAAQGRSPSVPATKSSSKASLGDITSDSSSTHEATGGSWADDVETGTQQSASTKSSEIHNSHVTEHTPTTTTEDTKAPSGPSSISSPQFGASSTSTMKEDDWSSNPNGSSDSTWESKSQTSEVAVQPSELHENNQPAEMQENKTDEGNKDVETGDKDRSESSDDSHGTIKQENSARAPVLQEAPPPVVNIWKQRAQQFSAKTSTASPIPTKSIANASTGSSHSENPRPKTDTRRKANSVAGIPREADFPLKMSRDLKKPTSAQSTGREENQIRQGSKVELDSAAELARRGPPKPTDPNKEVQNISAKPPPPVQDPISWPTPESAQDEERRRAQGKEEKGEKDKVAEQQSSKAHSKTQWAKIPFVPSAVFETPIPIIGGRRGGRPAPRGGRDANSRGGISSTERSGTSTAPFTNNSSTSVSNVTAPPRRGRSEAEATTHEQSNTQSQSLRAASVGSRGARPATETSTVEPLQTAHQTGNAEKINTQDAVLAHSSMGRANTFPRQQAPYRRNRSPKKFDTSASNTNYPDGNSVHSFRRVSVGTQTEEDVNAQGLTTSEEPGPAKGYGYDRRGDTRSHEHFASHGVRESKRGGTRGGRGRGGYNNGYYSGTHQYGNAHTSAYPSALTNGVPSSTSSYQTAQAGGYSSHPHPRHRHAASRSQSIPQDTHGRGYGGYQGGPQHLSSIQTQWPPQMFDFPNGYSTTAVPANDPYLIMSQVSTQVEYYFTLDNMLKDMYLRKHMDSQGYVLFDIVANFKRLKMISPDADIIKYVCHTSPNIDYHVGPDGVERLRKKEGWETWVLSMEERDPSARNDGPSAVEIPSTPRVRVFEQPQPNYLRQPASAGYPSQPMRYESRYSDVGYHAMNSFTPAFAANNAENGLTGLINGEEMRGRRTKSPNRDAGISPNAQTFQPSAEEQDKEPDTFPNERIPELTVVLRKQDLDARRVPFHSAASRTFSNGSIDSRNILDETSKPDDRESRSVVNGDGATNGDEHKSLSRQTSNTSSRSPDKASANNAPHVFWVKDKEAPVKQLPANDTHEPYSQLRHKALQQRDEAATGTCPYDLDVLYQFWSHFLIRNFNTRMYNEFRHFASEDAAKRHSFTGMDNLIKYYSESLLSQNVIRDRIAQDYVDLVKSEKGRVERTALKQMRAAWRNGALNMKNRKKLGSIVDEDLKKELEP
ncbi:hypothetical protein LTR50_000161 [Elasticomyces elasticus]|nr:hypothetical protein LTR50_000161 [Elasticomyces elasticus]